MRRYHPRVLAKYIPTSATELLQSSDDVEMIPENDLSLLNESIILPDIAKKVIIDQKFWQEVSLLINKSMYDDAQRLLVA